MSLAHKAFIGLVIITAAACGTTDQVDTSPNPTPTSPTGSAHTTTSASVPIAIGEVPGRPAVAAALRPWVADVERGDLSVLREKCWTIAPSRVEDTYADRDAIAQALAHDGIEGQFAYIWRSDTTEVSVKRSEVQSGYACPRVTAVGPDSAFTLADASHTVNRYLARTTGQPKNPADTEENYPLICNAAMSIWDPDNTGNPSEPPLAHGQGELSGVVSFDAAAITSRPGRLDYVSSSVPVRFSNSSTPTVEFLLHIESEGYCIGEVRR